MKKWKCSLCGYVYDPERESPPGEAAGAARCAFVDEDGELKDTFVCGQCGASRENFMEYRE